MTTKTLPKPPLVGAEPDLNLGTITSGACSSPQAQALFDAQQAGKPPLLAAADAKRGSAGRRGQRRQIAAPDQLG
jgi:hypothetical protein